MLLLFGVRWAADRIEPGYGTAAAITLGMATMLMIFASEYFSHVISAALAFAAFLVLWRERDGSPALAAGRRRRGCWAGLAITFEYQVGLVGVVLLFYALARSAPRLPRDRRLRRRRARRACCRRSRSTSGPSARRWSSPTAPPSTSRASAATTRWG